MKIPVLACLIWGAAATSSTSQSVFIERVWTCAEWAESRQAERASLLEEHVVGFLNGIALTSGRDLWAEGGAIDTKQVFFWMDQYCGDNPLGYLATGVAALAKERLGDGWNTPPE